MKAKGILILVILILAGTIRAQQTVVPLNANYYKTITITLDSTEAKYIYLPLPTYRWGDANPDSSVLTIDAISAREPTNFSGNLGVGMILDSLSVQESDSLLSWVKPYVYHPTKQAWYRSANDSTFLVWDTPDQYTSNAADYLDWTHGKLYTVSLSGETWPFSGLAFGFKQFAANNAGAASRVYLVFYIIR